MSAGQKKHVIVVGGGASGVLLACHLLRDGADDIHVTLVEKRPTVGRGQAYSTAQAGHLLNVRASNMSAFADDPQHFCRWLARHDEAAGGRQPDPLSFAQRRVYGRYISSLVAPLLWDGDKPGRLELIYGEARSLVVNGSEVRVGMDDGRTILGELAVLATGHEEASRPGESCFVSPWESPGDAGVPRDATVLVQGTGLTMVDYVVSLRANNHRGKIYGISRRGLLPQAHRPVSPLPLKMSDIPQTGDVVELWRWLRALVEHTTKRGGDWRSAVDGIRPYAWRIWRDLSFDAKHRFLRHARPWWEVHRHRMAPEIEREVTEARASGQLQIVAAKILSIDPVEGGAKVSYRRRGKREIETLDVARVVQCTGVYTDPLASNNAVIRHLIEQRLARPDPLGIGIDISRDCAIIDQKGHVSDRLFAVGPLTRAAFWEIMAVPDIRVQCAELSKQLRERLGAVSPGGGEAPNLLRQA